MKITRRQIRRLVEAVYKEEMRPFKTPKDIYFFPVNYKNGKTTDFGDKKAIIEAFKEKTIEEINLKNLSIGQNYDKFTKFRRFY